MNINLNFIIFMKIKVIEIEMDNRIDYKLTGLL